MRVKELKNQNVTVKLFTILSQDYQRETQKEWKICEKQYAELNMKRGMQRGKKNPKLRNYRADHTNNG